MSKSSETPLDRLPVFDEDISSNSDKVYFSNTTHATKQFAIDYHKNINLDAFSDTESTTRSKELCA